MKLTIIGIGQSLRGDDAAGQEALARWQKAYPATAARADIFVQTSNLPGLSLLDLIAGCDAALLLDAVQSSAEPGTIHRLGPEALSAFGAGAKSAHGWGVAETLEMDRQLNPGRRSTAVRLIGIEAQQLELGQPLSEAVERAMPLACRYIQDEVEALLAGAASS